MINLREHQKAVKQKKNQESALTNIAYYLVTLSRVSRPQYYVVEKIGETDKA